MKKKIIVPLCAALLSLGVLAGCAGNGGAANGTSGTAKSGINDEITVISREEGSGTRSAFIELVGVKQDDVDNTVATADITNSTGVMLTSVSQNEAAIGYVSLGSLNDTVKALDIDGVAATLDNVSNNSYAISRPFNIATKAEISAAARDFIAYILSADGQAVIADNGYVTISDAPAYSGSPDEAKLVVAGSSSVSPVMEKLIEAYGALNPQVKIELQTSDSTTGMNSAVEGVCDIGMASRELKDSELQAGLTATVIAMDGIAVIVNPANPLDGLTSQQVRDIYTGNITKWSELN